MNYQFSISKEASNLLKFLSCLFVAFSHYYAYIVNVLGSNNIIYKCIDKEGGYIGVAMFFFLSGYGLMESDTHHHLPLTKFLKRRLSKVYIPVLLITAIWMCFCIVFINGWNYNNIWSFIYTLVWGFNDGAMWFIKDILVMYLIFYCFTVLYRRHILYAHLFIIIALSLLYLYSHYAIGIWSTISIPLFYVGILASINKDNVLKGIMLPLAVVSCIVLLISYQINGINLAGHALINYVIIFVLVLIGSLSELLYKIKMSSFFGALSFDIYLTHNKVLFYMKEKMDFISLWEWFLITCVCSIAFLYLRSLKLQDKRS